MFLTLAGCAASDEASTQEEATTANRRVVRVETMVLEPTLFNDIIEITGTVATQEDATLSAQTAATVRSLAPLGTTLSAGQTVAQLDDTLVKAAVRQAEAQVAVSQAQADLAEDTFKRQEGLYRDSIISALEFETIRAQQAQARAQLSQAQALLAQAQEQRSHTTITAPFAGTIEEHLVEIGEQVTPGVAVARLINTRRVKVKAGVPERYAADIRRGTPVEVSFKAYGGIRRTGTITFVGSAIDRSSRTFPIEVDLENGDGLMKPEMIANLYVTRSELPGRLVVPQTAVLRDENGASMFVVNKTDSLVLARRQPVVMGASYGNRAVIEAGLSAGDEVVIVGQTNITEGDALMVVTGSPKTD